jgi:hypothetical protein
MALVALLIAISNLETSSAVSFIGALVVLDIARASKCSSQVQEIGVIGNDKSTTSNGDWGSTDSTKSTSELLEIAAGASGCCSGATASLSGGKVLLSGCTDSDSDDRNTICRHRSGLARPRLGGCRGSSNDTGSTGSNSGSSSSGSSTGTSSRGGSNTTNSL